MVISLVCPARWLARTLGDWKLTGILPFQKPMKFRNDIREVLKGLFEWAGHDYKKAMKDQAGSESGRIRFSIDEAEVKRHYESIKSYFLGEFDRAALHLDVLDDAGERTPPFSDDDLFRIGFEHLLEWAGITLSSIFGNSDVEKFMDGFESGFDDEPEEITYIPIFGLYADQDFWKDERYKLTDNVEFGFLGHAERELLRIGAESIGKVVEAPGLANILPSLVMVVKRPLNSEKDVSERAVAKAVQNFAVFVSGMFRANVELPFQFRGIKTPWSPWNYSGGNMPRRFEDSNGRWQFGGFEWKVLEKYWNELHPDVLDRFAVTASRLRNASKRSSAADNIVDLAIALEGLFEGKSSLSYQYRTVLPCIVAEKFEERQVLHDKIKDFYSLRSVIVHGDTIESASRAIKRKFNEMSEETFKKEIIVIEKAIRDFFTILILNEKLRTSGGQTEKMLGKPGEIERNPRI